jgi:hypothetical protein
MIYHATVAEFMAVSCLYLLMTNKSSADLTAEELEDLIVSINEDGIYGDADRHYTIS